MSKIKVIMCPANRAPYVTNIENSLKNMQNIVGGYIEAHTMTESCVAVMNEEGRILAMPENKSFPWPGHHGDIFICGVDSDEFGDIQDYDKQFFLKAARDRWNRK